MGDIVNKTYHHSMQWQAPLTWMRVNIGYMRSEVDDLAKDMGENAAEMGAVLAEFDSAMETFAAVEMDLFTTARTVERSPTAATSELLPALAAMHGAFGDFMLHFNAHVQEQATCRADSALLMLCYCCGAELFTAHGRVLDAIDAFQSEIENNLN